MTRDLELIDFKKRGNAVRLYFGRNGGQTGDDWNDRPYEHNAGVVYDEYIEQIIDVFLPVDIDMSEPADNNVNSEYCKDDFINKKSWVLWVEKEYNDELNRNPVGIFFGDTLAEIKEKLKWYKPVYTEIMLKND